MKWYVKSIHKLILLTHTEELFIKGKRYIPYLIKFIPLHDFYKKGQKRIVKRDGVKYKIALNDYMQWSVFAGITDLSWQKAALCITNNSSMFDVGANCGAFTLKAAQVAWSKKVVNFKIHSFEPNPVIFEVLVGNLALNPHLIPYIELVNCGLGKGDDILTMHVEEGNSGGGRITEDKTGIEVNVTSIDNYVTKYDIKTLAFLKVDVEGYEPFVLAGAGMAIASKLPTIYIEITDSWFTLHGSSQEQIISYFEDLHYELFVESDDKFLPLAEVRTTLKKVFQYNLLATHV